MLTPKSADYQEIVLMIATNVHQILLSIFADIPVQKATPSNCSTYGNVHKGGKRESWICRLSILKAASKIVIRDGHKPALKAKFVMNPVGLWFMKSWLVLMPKDPDMKQTNCPWVHKVHVQKWTWGGHLNASPVHFYNATTAPWCTSIATPRQIQIGS